MTTDPARATALDAEPDIYTRSERLTLAAKALEGCIREFGDRAPDFCYEYYDAHTRADMDLIDDFDGRTDQEREADISRGIEIVNQVVERERLKLALETATRDLAAARQHMRLMREACNLYWGDRTSNANMRLDDVMAELALCALDVPADAGTERTGP